MKSIIEVKRVSEDVIRSLIEIGALYTDDTGIHANKPGVYTKKNSTNDR